MKIEIMQMKQALFSPRTHTQTKKNRLRYEHCYEPNNMGYT